MRARGALLVFYYIAYRPPNTRHIHMSPGGECNDAADGNGWLGVEPFFRLLLKSMSWFVEETVGSMFNAYAMYF